jgi:hypothetical protein
MNVKSGNSMHGIWNQKAFNIICEPDIFHMSNRNASPVEDNTISRKKGSNGIIPRLDH